MQVIQELRDGNGAIYYERTYRDEHNKVLGKEDIRFPTYTREQPDGNKTIIMYTRDMQPITDAFVFLNQKHEIFVTRKRAAPALRLLYSYEAIISKKLAEFTVSDIEAFKDFLAGTSYSGSDMQIKLNETRDNNTINAYLGIYRKYCDCLGIENSVLYQKTSRASHIVTGTFADDNAPYKHNKRVAKRHEVPRYISPEEFRKIISVIRSEYTDREEVIVRLMYENGLRIGEVLGLTNDDIVEEKVDGTGWVNVLYLRNRCSDNEKSQSSKGRMHPRSPVDYTRKEYNLYGYGYHKVPISHSLADLLFSYIEDAHLEAREQYGKDYWNRVTADRVRKAEKHEDPNFYIFLNTCGRPLLQDSWSCTMRSIFIAAGLEVDTGTKKHNLNHRFRHGFAMKFVNAGMGELELKEQLRHASLDSVACYYRPTTSDIIRTKIKFEDAFIAAVPELSELIDGDE